QRWPHRIGHTHLKDVRSDIAERVRGGELGYAQAVREGLYTPLGDGDVDLAAMVGFLREAGYDGWYVLEQDTALSGPEPDQAAKPRHDTGRSLRYLRELLGQRPG
ncbi:sugar phosphate isomerase/epimerase family protein, partial [Longimycelium tulufanense]|uniref:sugar phosphate isomerase/epimerase family protein n=1 Tax=Longimycelium tulufanense TaxID=907463 RepID=UPI001E462057